MVDLAFPFAALAPLLFADAFGTDLLAELRVAVVFFADVVFLADFPAVFWAPARPFLFAALDAEARAEVFVAFLAEAFLVLFALRFATAFFVVALATVRFRVDFFVALFLVVLLFEALLRAAAFLAIARLLGGEIVSIYGLRPLADLFEGGRYIFSSFPVVLESTGVQTPACSPAQVEASSVPSRMDSSATHAHFILRRSFSKKWRTFVVSSLLAVAIAGCSVAFAWLSGQLIVAITEAGRDRWIMLGGALLAAAVVRGVLQYFRTWISESLVQGLSHELRAELFTKILHATAMGPLDSDEVAHRLGPDVQRSEAMIHVVIANLPLQVLTGLAVGGYAFLLDWPAALLASGTATVLLLAITWLTRRNREAHRKAWDRQAELATLTAGTARGADVLRSYSATGWAQTRFRNASDHALTAMMKAARLRGLTGPVVTIGAVMAALAVLFAVGSRFEAGHLTPADAGSIAIALLLFLRPIQAGAMSAPTISSGLAALDRLSEVLLLSTRIHPDAPSAPRPGGELELRSAAVKTQDGHVILRDAETTVAPNQTVAIIGPSGAGKTTLLRALSKQVELESGALFLQGEPVDDPRGLFSLVPERPVLFRATLRENITLGAKDDERRLERVLEEVGLRERIRQLDAGPETVLEKIGGEFSAGERQRLCLARALYRRAPFLMLDEPTAHLDPTTAEALIQTLRSLLTGRTVVLVTHDERLARVADQIIVVGGGRIVAQGPGDLIRDGIAYQSVFEKRSAAHPLVRAAT